MVIDIDSRAFSLQTRYLRRNFAPGGEELDSQLYWKRILHDLHTGRIGGQVGKLLADFVSISLLLFAMSGAYLWLAPKLIRRQRQRKN